MGAVSGPYVPNSIDPLDVAVAELVNSQPLYVRCERFDLPINKAAAAVQTMGEMVAKYTFGDAPELGREGKLISCKLVERGPRRAKKVLCRVGGGEFCNA